MKFLLSFFLMLYRPLHYTLSLCSSFPLFFALLARSPSCSAARTPLTHFCALRDIRSTPSFFLRWKKGKLFLINNPFHPFSPFPTPVPSSSLPSYSVILVLPRDPLGFFLSFFLSFYIFSDWLACTIIYAVVQSVI